MCGAHTGTLKCMASYHLCGLEASDNTLRWRGVAPITVALAGAHRAALTRRLAVLGAGIRRLAAVDTPAVVVDPHALAATIKVYYM